MSGIKIPVHGAMRRWEYIEEYGGNCILNPISGFIKFPGDHTFYIVSLYRIIKFIRWGDEDITELHYGHLSKISYYGDPDWILIGDIGYDLALLYGFILDAIQIAKENGFESKELNIMEKGIR